MAKTLQALIADLQPLAQQMSDANGAAGGRPVESEITTIEPEPAPLSNVSSDVPKTNIQAAGLTIGIEVDKNSPMELEPIEVVPEPDGSFRITVTAKRKERG
jgi:hypothetical protein